MTKCVQLKSKTDPKWVQVIVDNFDEFLVDHADCEKKASAMCMGIVSKCPDRVEIIPTLVDLALEELTHFKMCYELMRERGLKLHTQAIDDPYVNALLQLCRSSRDNRFLDRLLTSSIIEARGAERFRIVADALIEPKLKNFYKMLYSAEARHGNVFAEMALNYFHESVIDERLDELTDQEAQIVAKLKWRPSLH